MTDQIKGEVLVPQSRFLPKCEHDMPYANIDSVDRFGESRTVILTVDCAVCTKPYEQELPMGVPGIPHGQTG